MSHTNYSFNLLTESLPRQKMILRSVASAKYGGDWYSIPHAHTYTELFYIVGGDGQFQINDMIFPVQPNQLVVVNPNILHTEVSYEDHPLEYIVLGIEGLELTTPGDEDSRHGIYSFPERNAVLNCMRSILQEMQDRKQEYETICLAYMDIITVLPGLEAGLALLAADVDLQQDVLDQLLFGGLLLDGLHQIQPVHTLNEVHMAHHLLDLVGLEHADEVDGSATVCVFLLLGHQLLDPVLAAAVHAAGDGLPDGIGAVHLGGGAELDFFGITAAGNGSRIHLRPDPGDVFSDGHDLSPFVQTKM